MIQNKDFKAGDILFREGEKQSWMYIILWGKVDLYADYVGDRQYLTTLGKGDFFGEMGMLDNEPRSATAVVKEDASLAIVDEDNFEEYCMEHPIKAHRLLRSTSRRIRQLSEDYLTACRALVAYREAEETGAEKSPELLATMKKIAKVSKGN